MAYGYLLAPSFQFVNINGRPLVGGHIEVFIHNTDTKYITKADFDGTDNPFKVPLNSKGMAVIIASGDFSYDVFCYDRFGSPFWSGINVTIDNSIGLVIDGAELPMRIVGGKITNNGVGIACSGTNSWAEGDYTTASGNHSHSEGSRTIASGDNSHAEGGDTRATGEYSHSEGFKTKAGSYGHAEGAGTETSDIASHAEGRDTNASGEASHAEGRLSTASGDYSHASGYGTRATGEGSTAVGKYNDDGDALFVVGNGAYDDLRKDVFKVDRNENTWVMISGVLTKVTNVSGSGGGGDQIVLVRSDMTSNFTDAEYQDCVDAVTAGKAVCVQYGSSQIQLGGIAGSALIFTQSSPEMITRYTVNPTGGAHTVSIDRIAVGVPIYASLQSAIADEAKLPVGTYFETNGFYTSGDGGAARYKVSSTGTANGMDIVQLAAGKLAILQVNANREMYPEQFGYDRFASQDVTPVFTRMASQNVRNIRLLPCGSDNYPYLMKTGWIVSSPDISITGYSGLTTGYASRIWFKPDSYGADVTPMFSPTKRGFRMKDIVIFNRPWFTEGDKHNCVAIYMATNDTNKMWYDFDNLSIQGFDIGIGKLPVSGSIGDGLIWHCEFHKLQMALNNKNVYLKGLSYVTKFDNCFFTANESGAQSIVIEESFTVEFNRCNFGIYNPADTIIKCQDYLVTGKPVDVRVASLKFTNCNFELESDTDHPLPTDKNGIFVKCEDHDDFHLEFDNCCFIDTPLARNNIYSDTLISLGANTSILMTNCNGPYSDVNYPDNEFYSWDYQKRFFDRTKHPRKAVGSVVLEQCVGIIPPPNNAWGSVYLPVVKTDDMTCPQCDNGTDFLLNYPTAKDGLLLMNLDTAGINTKMGNSLVQVVSPQTGKVRIGDRIYDYVTIDGREWITTNLQLWTINTREWHFPDHPEFGFYYGVETFPEIDTLLPAGWRRPNYADCQSIINQGYAAVQATGQTAFPNATNTTGLSILPCYRWSKPNTSVAFDRGFFWGPEESGVGWHAVNVRAANISYAGWPYSDANGLKIPLRVCCDA